MTAKSVLLIVFLGMVYSSTAAPVMEADNTASQELVKTNLDKQETTGKINSESSPSTTDTPLKPESGADVNEDVNKEVTNYQTIERDSKNRIPEVYDTENQIDDEGNNRLTDDEARELLLELSDSETVARFVVESDDAQGFLRALRLLKDQNYISLQLAYYLRDEVMDRLQRMLMIQELDLSRTLVNDYEPVEFTPNQLPNDEHPAPYYGFNAYGDLNSEFYSQELAPYEDSLTEDKSQALTEFGEAVAQKIANGELSPDRGFKILETVAELLPAGYWQASPEIFSGGNNFYPIEDSFRSPSSDYSSLVESVDDGFKNSEDVIDGDEGFEDTDEGEEGRFNEGEEAQEEGEGSEELENELKNRNGLTENVLEKQLVETAHNKDNIVKTFDTTNIEDLHKDDDMTENDYEAFFNWLEREMYEMPIDIEDLDTLLNSYESSKEDEHFKNGS